MSVRVLMKRWPCFEKRIAISNSGLLVKSLVCDAEYDCAGFGVDFDLDCIAALEWECGVISYAARDVNQ